jgi:hypothetical protein
MMLDPLRNQCLTLTKAEVVSGMTKGLIEVQKVEAHHGRINRQ